MITSTFASAVLFLPLLQVAVARPTLSSSRPCVEFTVPVSATSINGIYNVTQVDDNIDAVAFALDFNTRLYPNFTERLIQEITVSGTYKISAQLCVPPDGENREILQIATHGVGFDSRYWDAQPPNAGEDYSYINAALQSGYSILTYDRLGTGKSDKPDAYKVVQAPFEIEILRGLTELARNGSLYDVAQIPGPHATFQKVVHIGHSYGSFVTVGLITAYGNLSDGAIATGGLPVPGVHSSGQTWAGAEYAPQNSAQLFGDAPSGYIVVGNPAAMQTGFFSTLRDNTAGIGGFEPHVLDYAFSIRATASVGEFTSMQNSSIIGPALDFTGPLQFFVGEFDFLACDGDCEGLDNTAALSALYPKVKDLNVSIQPGTGHGLTLHRGAAKGYETLFAWLHSNGL